MTDKKPLAMTGEKGPRNDKATGASEGQGSGASRHQANKNSINPLNLFETDKRVFARLWYRPNEQG